MNKLYFLLLLSFSTLSEAQDVTGAINKHGIDKVANSVARKLNSTLPQKKDQITTHIKTFYEEDNRYFYFIYQIADNGFDEAVELELTKKGSSKESIDDTKVFVSMMEETLFSAVVKNERASFVKYFCNHSYYRPMMRSGVVIRYLYKYKKFENIFNIGSSDC